MGAIDDTLADVGRRGVSIPEVFAASWDTLHACFFEWLTTIHTSARPSETNSLGGFMKRASVMQIIKYLKLLVHAEKFEHRRGSGIYFNFMEVEYGGEKLSLDHDLASIYATAARCVRQYDLRTDYWQLLHPINKFNLFKQYLESKGVVFQHKSKDCHKRKRSTRNTLSKKRKKVRRPTRAALKREWNAVKQELVHDATLSGEDQRSSQRNVINRSRNGQGTFRKGLIDECDRRCPITHVDDPVFLQAAHLVPWSTSCSQDFDNGVLLYATVHIAMDRGYVTFDKDGQLWRRRTADIRHLHIRSAKMPDDLLTEGRRAWLGKAYEQWLEAHNISEDELCKVEHSVADAAEPDEAGDASDSVSGDDDDTTDFEEEEVSESATAWQTHLDRNWERLQELAQEDPPASATPELSAYEIARLQRIKDNNDELARLGLSPIQFRP